MIGVVHTSIYRILVSFFFYILYYWEKKKHTHTQLHREEWDHDSPAVTTRKSCVTSKIPVIFASFV